MSTKVEKTVVVDVPVSAAYNQWTQFEDFPHFMSGVKSVTQLSDDRLEWVAEIGGVRRQWEARIVEQVPDRRVAWAATEGAINAGAVSFEDAGTGRTSVHLVLEYDPEGLVEKVGDKLDVVEDQAEGDLERFKKFIEFEDHAAGAWRGAVNEDAPVGTPGVEAAVASRGDEGKAGVSGKVVAAGAAAAGAAAVGAAAKKKDSGEDTDPVTIEAPISGRTDLSADSPLSADGETGVATDAGTPAEAPTAYDTAWADDDPVPPTGSTEGLFPLTGAPRADADSDIPEKPLGVDAALDEEPAPPQEKPSDDESGLPAGTPAENRADAPLDEESVLPLEDTPPMIAPDVAPVDVIPPESGRAGVDPVTGRPADDDRPTSGTV